MSIHELLKSKEGDIWHPADTAEVERILREIDRTAEAAVQRERSRGKTDTSAPPKRADARGMTGGDA